MNNQQKNMVTSQGESLASKASDGAAKHTGVPVDAECAVGQARAQPGGKTVTRCAHGAPVCLDPLAAQLRSASEADNTQNILTAREKERGGGEGRGERAGTHSGMHSTQGG